MKQQRSITRPAVLDTGPAGRFVRATDCVMLADLPSSLMSCIHAFQRYHLVKSGMQELLSAAPIPLSGVDERLLRFIGKRVGISMLRREVGNIGSEPNEFFIGCRDSGYCVLMLSLGAGNLLVFLPGHPERLVTWSVASLGEMMDVVYHLHLGNRTLLDFCIRPIRLNLISWSDDFLAIYDPNAVRACNSVLSTLHFSNKNLVSLEDFTVAAVKDCHRSMFDGDPRYVGVFRGINIRRSVVFVDFRCISETLEALLEKVRHCEGNMELQQLISFASCMYMDFLSIHPFINGNRRMAGLLLVKFMAIHGWRLRWENVTVSEVYYSVRSASRGHFLPLRKRISGNLQAY